MFWSGVKPHRLCDGSIIISSESVIGFDKFRDEFSIPVELILTLNFGKLKPEQRLKMLRVNCE
jgi:hypothetical protein